MNGAHEKRFLGEFNVDDVGTVRAVATHFLPKIEAELAEVSRMNDECMRKTGEAMLGEYKNELEAQVYAVRQRLFLSPHYVDFFSLEAA